MNLRRCGFIRGTASTSEHCGYSSSMRALSAHDGDIARGSSQRLRRGVHRHFACVSALQNEDNAKFLSLRIPPRAPALPAIPCVRFQIERPAKGGPKSSRAARIGCSHRRTAMRVTGRNLVGFTSAWIHQPVGRLAIGDDLLEAFRHGIVRGVCMIDADRM